jgi:hypothetical protein
VHPVHFTFYRPELTHLPMYDRSHMNYCSVFWCSLTPSSGALFNCMFYETYQVITSTYWLHIIGSHFPTQNAQLWISCTLLTILIDITYKWTALMTKLCNVCVENCDLITYGQVSAWNHLMCFKKFTVKWGSLKMVSMNTEARWSNN